MNSERPDTSAGGQLVSSRARDELLRLQRLCTTSVRELDKSLSRFMAALQVGSLSYQEDCLDDYGAALGGHAQAVRRLLGFMQHRGFQVPGTPAGNATRDPLAPEHVQTIHGEQAFPEASS